MWQAISGEGGAATYSLQDTVLVHSTATTPGAYPCKMAYNQGLSPRSKSLPFTVLIMHVYICTYFSQSMTV